MARQVPASAGPWLAKRGTISHCLTSIVAKHQKIEGGPFGEKKFRRKFPKCRKTERGYPLVFFNIHSVAKHQKIERGPFGEFFSRK